MAEHQRDHRSREAGQAEEESAEEESRQTRGSRQGNRRRPGCRRYRILGWKLDILEQEYQANPNWNT